MRKVNAKTPEAGAVALITGASAGIGETFARRLAERGCDVILVARRLGRLDALAEELKTTFGIKADVLQADLADDANILAVADYIRNLPRLDYLINNAGLGTLGHFADTDVKTQDTMARLHMLAVMHLTHAALPGMIQRKRGYIVNVSSVAGFFQSPSNVMYCATKAWLNSFTDGLAIELEKTDVLAQALCPGFTYSEFHDVMGVDRATVPKSWWLDADFVVNESLKALQRGNHLCIPSWRYRIMVRLAKLIPRRLRVAGAKRRHRRALKQGLQDHM